MRAVFRDNRIFIYDAFIQKESIKEIPGRPIGLPSLNRTINSMYRIRKLLLSPPRIAGEYVSPLFLRHSYDLWLYTQYAALFKKTATARIIKEA